MDGGRFRLCRSSTMALGAKVTLAASEKETSSNRRGEATTGEISGESGGLILFTTTSGGGNPEVFNDLCGGVSVDRDSRDEVDGDPGGVADIVDSSQSSPIEMSWILSFSFCMIF